MIMYLPIKLLLFYGSALTFAVFLAFCIIVVATTAPYPVISRSKNEEFYVDPKTRQRIRFPSLADDSSVNLSVIIPAYNEATRIVPMLDECLDFLEERLKTVSDFTYEIIVVSDGSRDDTVKVVQEYSQRVGSEKLRVLELERNRGKGGAVRLGMQSARGALLLFADADGATKFSDLTKLETSLSSRLNVDYCKRPQDASNALGVAIGSRAHLQDEAVATRNFFRTILMYGFHFLVWLFAVRGLRDTQCGFKLLTRNAARICFGSIHVESWAFDVELLYIAQKLKMPIVEVAVNWTEIDGSKLTPVWSWIQMGKDLGLIWLRYTIGAWKIKELKQD